MIRFENVTKFYGKIPALHFVNGTVAAGEVVVVCGPSGSGKSTLIRVMNRLEPIQQGSIHIDGRDIMDRSRSVNALRTDVGFVFQNFGLFSHLDALGNVTLALRHAKGLSRSEAEDRGIAQLRKLGLADHARKRPSRLSGGQQQRVAIARALVLEPKVLLLDEPTSALDPEMIGEVLRTIEGLAQEGITMMCVTHEMGFARRAADRIWFMEDGALRSDTTPGDFFGGGAPERARRFLSTLHG